MLSWYEIKAQADGEYEVVIYDEIGFWGVTAKQFITEFKQIPAEARVNLRINSPGGDVFDSLAIYNVIRRHAGEVVGTVDGLAASGASIIAMAASHLAMPENAFLMIHNSSGLAIGNADDMRDLADVLEKIDSSLVATYVGKSGQTAEAIADMLSEETWLTAKEALDLGFADEVIPAVKIAARASYKRFVHPPQALMADTTDPVPPADPPAPEPSPAPAPADEGVDDPPAPSPAPEPATDAKSGFELVETDAKTIRAEAAEIVKLCNRNGLPDMAAEFFAKGARLADVQKRFQHGDNIRARCVASKMPERAAKYIAADMTPDEVGDHLLKLQQALDAEEIDNKQRGDGGQGVTGRKYTINPWAITKRYQDKEKSFGRKP